MSFRKEEDPEEPLKRYRPKKPNYYPEPPPDGFFSSSEPLDRSAIIIIRVLTVSLFLLVAVYAFLAWFFTHNMLPQLPNISVNNINISTLNMDDIGRTITSRIDVQFNIENPDQIWNGIYDLYFNVSYKNRETRLAYKTMEEVYVDSGSYLLADTTASNSGVNVNPMVIPKMRRELKYGNLTLVFGLAVKVSYKRSGTNWGVDGYYHNWECKNLRLKFSSNEGHMVGKPVNCTLLHIFPPVTP